jgi:predicted amidohydrolase
MNSPDVTVACLQLDSGQHVAENLQTVLRLVTMAVEKDQAQWIVLPENAFCHPYDNNQQAELDKVLPVLQKFCQEKSVWLFAGSIPVPVSDGSGKVYSALHVINDRGEIAAVYHKLHLFDVHVAEAHADYRESDTFVAGNKPVVVDTPWGKVGLAICYDLRFPELFLAMEAEQPFAFVVPSAFTLHTGQRHWHTLLKARAIDTFTWVLAADQTGMKANGRATFGYTAIVDPDGKILAELAEGEGYITQMISSKSPENLRKNIPLGQHRHLKPD